jgi:hypothetical protein
MLASVRGHLKSRRGLRWASTQPFPVEELYNLQSFVDDLGFDVNFVNNGVEFTKQGKEGSSFLFDFLYVGWRYCRVGIVELLYL